MPPEAAEDTGEDINVEYDVDSVWALSSDLTCFNVRDGLHHIPVSMFRTPVRVDFSKKSSLGAVYEGVVMVTQADFPVYILVEGVSMYRFMTGVLTAAMRQLPHHRQTAFRNWYWLRSANCSDLLRMFKVKSIHVHTSDFQALQTHIGIFMQQFYPEASVKYAVYMNGMHGDVDSILIRLRDFLAMERLECVLIHYGAEVTMGDGRLPVVHADGDLPRCELYSNLGQNGIRGFTTKQPVLLRQFTQGVGSRCTFLQGYYPMAVHGATREKVHNMPITLASMYGFRSGNPMLENIRVAGVKHMRMLLAGLEGYVDGPPLRFELVAEWRNDQPLEEYDELLSRQAIDQLGNNLRRPGVLAAVPRERITAILEPLLDLAADLDSFVNDPYWPMNMPAFRHIAGAEAVLKACVNGSTQWVNYGTLTSALGGRTLAEATRGFSPMQLETPLPASEYHVEADLRASEADHADVVTLWMQVISEPLPPHEIAQALVQAITNLCSPPTLTLRAVQKKRGARVEGQATVDDVLSMLKHMEGNQSPMRTFVAMMTVDGVEYFEADNFDQEVEQVLLSRCQVFPTLRPVSKDQDFYSRFQRLTLTPDEVQFANGLEFMETQLKMYSSKMVILTSDHPAVVACMTLARHMAGTDRAERLTKWTAWLFVLLLCAWDDAGKITHAHFSWHRWHRQLGWREYGQPLVSCDILEELTDEQRDGVELKHTLFGKFRVCRGVVRRIIRQIHRLEQAGGPPSRDPAVPAGRPEANDASDGEAEVAPVRRRRRRKRQT